MCLATKGATADSLSMCYTNVNDDAPWLETMGVVPWEFTPAYAQLTGFQLTYIQPDILHCWHLGTGRDLAASALVFMVKGGLCFAGSTQAERLEGATIQLKEFCKERQLPLKLHKLSKSKLNWKSKAMPELRSSGYDTYVVVKWLTHVCERYSAVLPRDLCFALWAGNHVLSILSNAGRFLTPLEQSNKNTFGDAFMHAYVRLANESISSGTRLFRLRPKLHIWHHILKSRPRSRLNNHYYSTWMDEDFLKRIMKTHRLTSKMTAPKRMLQRYLLGLPKIWSDKMRSSVPGVL